MPIKTLNQTETIYRVARPCIVHSPSQKKEITSLTSVPALPVERPGLFYQKQQSSATIETERLSDLRSGALSCSPAPADFTVIEQTFIDRKIVIKGANGA